MKKNNQNDKIRVWALGITVLLVVSTLILFSVTIYRKGNAATSFGSGIIAAVILIFAIVVWKRQYTSVKKGFPVQDERSRQIQVLAGYYTFLISIWYLLVLSWASDDLIQFRDPAQALGIGILGMAIIFGVCWIWVSRKGVVG